MVDGGDVHALGELLLVTQEPAHLRPDRPVDVDDRLAVGAVEHGAGEALDDGRRHLVVRGSGRALLLIFYVGVTVLVSVFTSVVVGHRFVGPRNAVLSGGQRVGTRAVALLDLDRGAAMRGAGASLQDLAAADLVVEHQDPVHERLRPGRAAGDVHVDGDDLVDTLDERVVVEHAARARADAHRDDPLGLDHLVVHLAQDRRHLLAEPAGDDHEVGLAGTGAEHLHAVARQVVVRRARGHHLQRAAREPEGRGPHRVAPRPLDQILQSSRQERVRNLLETHQAAFSPRLTAGSRPVAPGLPDARSTPALTRPTTLRIGPQSSAPVDNRYANGTSNVRRNTPMITSPYAAGAKFRKIVVKG